TSSAVARPAPWRVGRAQLAVATICVSHVAESVNHAARTAARLSATARITNASVRRTAAASAVAPGSPAAPTGPAAMGVASGPTLGLASRAALSALHKTACAPAARAPRAGESASPAATATYAQARPYASYRKASASLSAAVLASPAVQAAVVRRAVAAHLRALVIRRCVWRPDRTAAAMECARPGLAAPAAVSAKRVVEGLMLGRWRHTAR